jgi:pilus assembly protein CpaB
MKNKRALIAISFAVIAGLVAVVLASRWMAAQAAHGASKIVVAAVDLDLGRRLSPEMLKLTDWPAGSIPQGAFQDVKAVDTRVTRTNLQRGEPILQSKLAPIGTNGGLSAVIDPGKRAITVRVNDVVGVAGFALPGNYVDVLVSTQAENAKGSDKDQSISKIVLERILVLAVAQEANRDETKPKVVNAVTLEVTPEQAEKLDLARSVGTLSLVLRNQVDPKSAQTEGATKQTLLNSQPFIPTAAPIKPEEPKKPAKKVTGPRRPTRSGTDCVEVIRGSTKTMECF